ncbi:MAG: radical SAM protein [Spirochaetes bacterium]|nr:radical SAM protein [Spirochaetota bacterium]
MRKKVLLINPPYPFEESPTPPFGLMSLAAYLLGNDIDVVIEDYIITSYSGDKIRKVISEYQPDFIGATGVTMNINKSLSILKECSRIKEDTAIVLGGPHATFDADAILKEHQYIDFIVRREGEVTFTELIKKSDNPQAYTGITGISYRQNGSVINNPDRPLIEDINVLPFPARHLVQLSKYKAIGYPLNMITSRGCPHNCIFCVGRRMVGSRVRYFNVNRVVDEFEMLSKMGFTQINVVDDLFTANQKRCIAICDEIMRRGIKHKWNAFSRVDTVSRELLTKLKQAGCEALCFGIESGEQKILDTAKKKISIEKIKRAITLCNETGISPMASYIMGLPGETAETIEKSLKFARDLCPNYGFHILTPFPGTEVRDKRKEFGIRILTNDWDKYDANQPVCDNGTISPDRIIQIADSFNNLFNNYVDDLLIREKNGEELSPKDRSYMDNLHKLAFSLDMIQKEWLENYPGLSNADSDSDVKKDFLLFIQDKTNADKARAEELLDRLFSLNCIRIEGTDIKRLVWC